jgi:hypothetical protein
VPANIELDAIREGVPAPLGDTDLDPVGVVVEAKRDDTEALEPRYGKLAIEDATEGASCARSFGNLIGDAMIDSGGLMAGASPRDISKSIASHPPSTTLHQVFYHHHARALSAIVASRGSDRLLFGKYINAECVSRRLQFDVGGNR